MFQLQSEEKWTKPCQVSSTDRPRITPTFIPTGANSSVYFAAVQIYYTKVVNINQLLGSVFKRKDYFPVPAFHLSFHFCFLISLSFTHFFFFGAFGALELMSIINNNHLPLLLHYLGNSVSHWACNAETSIHHVWCGLFARRHGGWRLFSPCRHALSPAEGEMQWCGIESFLKASE